MMRQALAILLVLSIFICVTATAYVWANTLVNSIYGYRTPMKGAPPLTQETHPPLTSQVVLLLIDGLRYDTSLNMPQLNTLRQQGAHAKLIVHPPSNRQTAWATLISGATPEINDVPLFDRAYEWLVPLSVDHMFSAVTRAGLSVGLAGSYYWEKLVPDDLLYTKYFVSAADDAADQAVVERATSFLQEFRPSFLLVHIGQLETIGQTYGGSSLAYQEAALRCDNYIGTLRMAMDLERSVLMVVSSYGHLDEGGHGGGEAAVLHTPFVMAGESIWSGNYGPFAPQDLVPTISALLGTPTPSSAQGRILSEMLRAGQIESAEKWVALARQRVRIGNIYVASIAGGALRESAEADMLVAISSLEVGNYQSAAELARLSVRETTQEMAQARAARIWRERWRRAGPIALAALIPLLLLWRQRSRRLVWSAFAAPFAAAIYHFLFLKQGNAYSFSRVPAGGLAATLRPSLARAAVALALGALFVVWQAWQDRDRSAFRMAIHTYGYAMIQLYCIALALGTCTFWNGFKFNWYLPNFTVAYVHFTLLMQWMTVAALAIPLPLLTIPLQQVLLALLPRKGSLRSHGNR